MAGKLDYTITRSEGRISLNIPTAGRVLGLDIAPGFEASVEGEAIEMLAAAADRYGRHPIERQRVREVATRAFEELVNG